MPGRPLQSLRRAAATDLRRVDALVAATMAGLSLAQVLVFPIAPLPLGVTIALASTIPIAFRRDHPVAATIAGTALWIYPSDGFLVLGYVAGALLFYSLAVEVDDLRVVAATLAFVLCMAVGALLQYETPLDQAIGEWLGAFLAVLGPGVVGRLVRRERRRTRRIAVAEERARIARELHDVVAHGLSVIAVQADAAEAALDADPSRAAAPVRTIRGAAQDALGEMRRMLGVLRDDEDDAGRAPQPGLARLPALVEGVRAAGVTLAVEVEGEPRALPPSLDLTAYRIVQEALTNVRRHAAGAPATLRLAWRPDVLELTVRDRGPGARGAPAGGHGLVGMRERVRIHGGRLRAGPAGGEGFEVVAELPLSPP